MGKELRIIAAGVFVFFAVVYIFYFIIGLFTHQPHGTVALNGVCGLFCTEGAKFLIDDRN